MACLPDLMNKIIRNSPSKWLSSKCIEAMQHTSNTKPAVSVSVSDLYLFAIFTI